MPRKTDAAAVDAARMDRRTWLTGALAGAGSGGLTACAWRGAAPKVEPRTLRTTVSRIWLMDSVFMHADT